MVFLCYKKKQSKNKIRYRRKFLHLLKTFVFLTKQITGIYIYKKNPQITGLNMLVN